ncbi:MAG: glycosyltransferase, partial [Deltaproteobacteria bacterium]|nr:glycosyltransferase [Deltaproteobacteria bacterium]
MHVLHVSDLCHLDASFGTERYQHDLVVESGRHGVRGTLLWLAARAVASPPGAAVRVVPLTTPSLDRLRGEVDGLLAADPPTLLHFHSCGRAESVVAQLARQRRIPAVFTYHSPATLCPTGSLLRWGAVVCDGALRAWRCGACTRVEFLRAVPRALHWQRLRQWSAATASIEIGEPESLRQRGRAARAFLASCDRVLVHGAATRRVPLANGVRPEAVTVCPPGVSAAFADAAPARVAPAESEPFVVGYVGRLDRLKGLGVLVDAFMRTTWPAARLRIAGVTAAQRHGAGYAQRVMARARRDPRIGFGGER